MPYSDSNSFELASYKPLQRILDSEKIRNIESRLKIKTINIDDDQLLSKIVEKHELELSEWQPDMVLAIDGSYQSVPVTNGFPSSEYGYVTVASVLILLDKIRELQKQEFINPVEFRKTETAATTESVYPGCNVVLDDDDSANFSMRKALFEELLNEAPFYEVAEKNKETLLETYEELLKIKRSKNLDKRLPNCPYEDCENDLKYDYKTYQCNCEKAKILFSTDALRLHELHNSLGICGEMYGQIMFTLERLWLIHILRGFEKQDLLKSLKNLAFMIDGPLAVYSTSSWLTKSIQDELTRINELQRKVNGQDLIILGIEKSGTFVNHFEYLDTNEEGMTGKFLPESGASHLCNECKYL